MMSERTTLIRLAALCLALAPLPAAFAYSETDLATLEETGSCSGCDLAGADLYEADLFQANLLGADLREADLTAADLTLADLRGVDLRGAILEETNLSGANLTAALLDKDALAGAVFDSERTRTTLGFKDLKLGMNAVEVAQYCSIEAVTGYLAEPRRDNALEGTCFDNADMPFAFKFSSGTTTGVLNFLQVGLAPYTKKGHRKFIDLLAKKYDPARSYSAQDVETFNNNREWDIKRLHTIFAGGQVTLSVVGEGAGLQMLLSYRDIEHGQRFLKLKGGPAPVDLAHLPPITTDLYKLVGNYKLKGIGAKGASTNHGRIDTAYLEIDAFENELAGELVISGHGMSGRFRIIGIETISGNRLTVQLEPVTGTIPDGRPLRMSLEFAEDGDSFTGKWTNWFNKSRRPDDFKGSRSQSFWQTAMSHNRIDMYQAYLRLRPGGIYSAVARSRITALGGTLAAPSAPTVSVAVTAAPSTSPSTSVTPTTTTTTTATAVDPLVGIWVRSPEVWDFDRCYLAVGQQNDGRLAGKSWGAHLLSGNNFVSQRDLIIRHDSHTTYFWEADKPQHNPEAYAPPDKSGTITRRETNLTQFRTNARICVKVKSVSKHSTFRKLTLEEALALELSPELLEDFPSPFATEGSQVVSVPKASASASPSTPTTTTATAVDPLVGIWHWQGGVWGYADSCYLAVGINDQGVLVGKSWETHLQLHHFSFAAEEIIGFNIVGVRDIAIGQVNDDSYTWKTEKTLPRAGDYWTKGGLTGKLHLNTQDQNVESLHVNNRICRKMQSESKNSRFKKLPLEEALTLELPPELLEGFPSPFATEEPPVASASAAPSTPTTTITTPVDPLVGVWKFAPADGVGWGYFIVGMDDQDRLAGFQWQNVHSETFGFRETTIKPLADESYSWHSDQSISLVNPSFAMGDAADGGKFWVSENENDLPTVTSSKELFLQWRGLPPRQTLQKIALEDALALELPPEVPQGFPSPFATEGPQVASVPKAAASASAAPSIPTTTTTAVDPLVGIWTRASGFHGDCHFIVGQRDDGTLTALAFQKFLRRNVIGNDSPIEWGLTDDGVGILARAISIKRTPKGTYSWQSSDNFQALGLPGFMANPPKKGSLSISKDKDGNPRITSNRLCVEDRAQPSTATYRKLPLNEAIAMELPSIAQKDFPSPFATEGPQVASVPKAAASASAAPSIPTTTTTAVDPLVGIWVRTGSDIAWTNECWLLVGQTEDGILIGKAQDSTRKHRGNFSDKGKNIHLQDGYAFGLKEISFERQSKMNYLWSSKSNPFKSESSIDPAMSGRISIQLNEQGSDYLVSKGLLCRKRQSQSLAKFRRLTITEALELTLHPDLLKDFPSPFVTEGPQVAGVPKASASASTSPSTSPSTSVTPTTTTTTATAVDPLVGIWHWQGGMWGFADSCYLAVGINDQGVLVGKSWETHQQTHLDVFFTAEEIIGSNIVGVRDITIGQVNDDSYTWKTEKTLQSPGEYWTKGGLTGKLHLNTQDQNVESLHVNNRICRKMRSESKNSRFKKLPLEEALALELPPELLEGFPSPFATQGPQVASVPKASASASTSPSTPTTTTATVVDPLVGIWHWAGGVFGNVDNCYLAVGISDGGALKAKAWETHRRDDLLGPFIGEQVIGHNIVGVRDISIIDVSGGTYNWQSIRPIPAVNGGAAGNIWSAADMAGRVHIDKGSDVNQMTANNRLCRKLHTDSKSGHFRKLPLEDALALELPPELLQGFPSPFQDGTRWSGDAVATEPIQAAKDQDTTSKTDGSDTR